MTGFSAINKQLSCTPFTVESMQTTLA